MLRSLTAGSLLAVAVSFALVGPAEARGAGASLTAVDKRSGVTFTATAKNKLTVRIPVDSRVHRQIRRGGVARAACTLAHRVDHPAIYSPDVLADQRGQARRVFSGFIDTSESPGVKLDQTIVSCTLTVSRISRRTGRLGDVHLASARFQDAPAKQEDIDAAVKTLRAMGAIIGQSGTLQSYCDLFAPAERSDCVEALADEFTILTAADRRQMQTQAATAQVLEATMRRGILKARVRLSGSKSSGEMMLFERQPDGRLLAR